MLKKREICKLDITRRRLDNNNHKVFLFKFGGAFCMDTNNKRKLRTGIMAALLMLLILLTGTYAWTQFNNVGFNAVYTETNFGGRFHDNFAWYGGEAATGQGVHDKSLFAENFGDNRIFVRVRLREFLRIGGDGVTAVGGADINNLNSWAIYVSEPGDATERRLDTDSATIGNRGITWNVGHPEDGKVFMPTFNHATRVMTDIHGDVINAAPLYAHAQAYRMLEATGMAVDGLASGLATIMEDSEQVEHVRDIADLGSQTGPGLLGHNDTDIDGNGQNESNPEHGESDFWAVGDTMTSRRLYIREDDNPELAITTTTHTHTARETLTPDPVDVDGEIITNGVITMQQWNQADRPRGNFWVKDTDGWFYWAVALAPATEVDDNLVGGATALLLNGVEVDDMTDEGVEYAVQVDVDFTNWTNVMERTLSLVDMGQDALDLWLSVELDFPEVDHDPANPAPSLWSDPETGTVWRVLIQESDPRGGEGNVLIQTEHVHNLASRGDCINPDAGNLDIDIGEDGNGVPGWNDALSPWCGIWLPFEQSRLRIGAYGTQAWFSNETGYNVGHSLRSRAMNFEYGPVDDLSVPAVPRTDPNAGIETDWTWGDAFMNNGTFWNLSQTSGALLRASTRPTGQPGAADAEPFILSGAELAAFYGGPQASFESRIARDNFGEARHWILRSPGNTGLGPRTVTEHGNVGGSPDDAVRGIRPALWVRP